MEPRAAVEQINNSKTTILRDLQIDENFNSDVNKLELRLFRHSRVNISILVYSVCLGGQNCPILIIASASADKSAAKYSEMSAILGVLQYMAPITFSLTPPPPKKHCLQMAALKV